MVFVLLASLNHYGFESTTHGDIIEAQLSPLIVTGFIETVVAD
ncbi:MULTISPECIES: hypothetical protein [Leptolyngbya]|nr:MULTISPECIES: hypothetical protein [Leptolyngbya]